MKMPESPGREFAVARQAAIPLSDGITAEQGGEMDQAEQRIDGGERTSLLCRPVPVPWQIGAGALVAAVVLLIMWLPPWPSVATWRLMPFDLVAVAAGAGAAGLYAGLTGAAIILLYVVAGSVVLQPYPVVHDPAWLTLLGVAIFGVALIAGGLRDLLAQMEQELGGTKRLLAGANRRLASALESERLRSYYDHVTDLPSRRMVIDRFTQGLAQARRNEALLAMLLLDLNRFREVNEVIGHDAGDEVLRQIGQRLSLVMRREDTVGRLDSDTFIILLTGAADIAGVTAAAQKVADALAEPFVLGSPPREIFVSASLGAAIYPQDGHDWDSLYHHAEEAVWGAKGQAGPSGSGD
ncbi:MAG TPA: GGDEF domain-containing protein [Acetobacteraceae bacterium]|nr:GGDEF domain-containing protein [Acetobacteraceae bacterium]